MSSHAKALPRMATGVEVGDGTAPTSLGALSVILAASQLESKVPTFFTARTAQCHTPSMGKASSVTVGDGR